MKSAADLIKDVDTIARELDLNDREAISVAVVELAQKNMGLGNWLADALEAERVSERDLKLARYKAYAQARKLEGTSQDDANAIAAAKTKDLGDELLEVQKAVALYKIKRNDVQTLIDTIRSRLAVIREDIKEQQ